MGVGRPRLVVQVVAVVPPRHQPEVPHWRKRRSAGADHDLHVPTQHLEPGGVASLRPLIGGEPDVPARTEQCGQGSVDPGDVTVVRHDDDRAAAALERGACRLGQQVGQSAAGSVVGAASHEAAGARRR